MNKQFLWCFCQLASIVNELTKDKYPYAFDAMLNLI